MKNFKLFLTTLALLLSEVSCNHSADTVIKGVIEEATIFPKITKYDIILECFSRYRTFKQDDKPVIVFRMTNRSASRLILYEWMMDEGNNIRLSYALADEKEGIPQKEKWKTIPVELKKPIKRMTLDLGPKNSVVIEKEIDLLNDILKEKINKPVICYLYGELNLDSITARSETINIKINP